MDNAFHVTVMLVLTIYLRNCFEGFPKKIFRNGNKEEICFTLLYLQNNHI